MKTYAIRLMVAAAAVSTCFGDASDDTYEFFRDDFESAQPAQPNGDPVPLLGNGMLVGANVFDNSDVYLYNYFGFDAPNITGDGARFSNVATGEGGPDQGTQVLSVFSDYNNGGAHTAGDLVDANVYVEFVVEEADLGTTVNFVFDAKFGVFETGEIDGSSPPYDAEAEAFLKVLDPANNFQPYPNIQVVDATQFPATWTTYVLTLTIDPAWEGKILQAGFRNKTSNYAPSSMFYDNISLTSDRVVVPVTPPQILGTSWTEGEFRVDFFGKDGFEYTLWKGASIEGPYDEFVDTIDGFDSADFLSDTFASDPSGFYILSELEIPQ
ncbi:MAG: hypothetical protein AAGB14_05000 [Verrucomicrobiota bacterium]